MLPCSRPRSALTIYICLISLMLAAATWEQKNRETMTRQNEQGRLCVCYMWSAVRPVEGISIGENRQIYRMDQHIQPQRPSTPPSKYQKHTNKYPPYKIHQTHNRNLRALPLCSFNIIKLQRLSKLRHVDEGGS
ncbi:hypothetical protein BDQ17DRAFT_1062821 [Cyathus striatus]|nr:hypothetical protein BDQ17DRAFT_1062821 [Cyathus striatus]